MPIFGAKSRAKRGCASKLACGHRIGPADCNSFSVIFGKFAISQRADVGIGPYEQAGTCLPPQQNNILFQEALSRLIFQTRHDIIK